jgi:hypothetical protein
VINKGSVWRLRVGERGRGGLRVEDMGRIMDGGKGDVSGWEKRWRIRVKSDPETEQKKHYICSTF